MRIGISLIFSLCALSLCAAPREEVKRDFQRTVPLAGGRSVRVDHSQGSVNVHTHSKSEVAVAGSIRCSANTQAEARNLCDQIRIQVEESSSGVTVRTEYPRNGRGNYGYSVNLDVAMPQTAPLNLRNRFGDVAVQNLHAASVINNGNGKVLVTGGRGKQQIENSFGSVEVLNNDGDVTVNSQNGWVRATDINGSADLSTRFGEVRANNVTGGLMVHGNNMQVDAERIGGVAMITSSFGDVRVLDAKSNVTVRNQNGRVNASGVAGAADLSTTFADVRFTGIGKSLGVHAQNSVVIGDTVGESVVIETTFGSVDVRGVKGGARVTAQNAPIKLSDIGGEAYAKTTFASTTVENVGGPITVESQNGSVTAAARPGSGCKPIVLRTTFAPIKVTVLNGVGYTVSARTTFGKIRSEADLTLNGQIGEGVIEGKIGAGGCELRLVGQNGDISILKR